MNRVVLIGRLGKDPELRFTASGKAVCQFSLAVNRPFSKEKEVDFFNIVVWGKVAENCAKYLGKGRMVGLEGRLQARSYDAQDGQKRYITEVVAENVEFLEFKDKGSQQYSGNGDGGDFGQGVPMDFQAADDDEDIPF